MLFSHKKVWDFSIISSDCVDFRQANVPNIPDNFSLNSIVKQEEYSREKYLIRLMICRMVFVISFKNRIEGKFLNPIMSQAPISFCSFSKCLWPIPKCNYKLFEYIYIVTPSHFPRNYCAILVWYSHFIPVFFLRIDLFCSFDGVGIILDFSPIFIRHIFGSKENIGRISEVFTRIYDGLVLHGQVLFFHIFVWAGIFKSDTDKYHMLIILYLLSFFGDKRDSKQQICY